MAFWQDDTALNSDGNAFYKTIAFSTDNGSPEELVGLLAKEIARLNESNTTVYVRSIGVKMNGDNKFQCWIRFDTSDE